MYISSDGTEKNPTTLNTEYLINGFAKSAREIFNSTSMENYNKYMNNLQILEKELYERIDKFVKEKMEDDTWL